jgi:hypothetical protein
MRSAMRVFDISLGQMLWSRRSVLLGLLVGAPVILAGAVRLFAATNQLPVINGAGLSGPTLFGILIWLLFVRFIVPVLGVFYGTALIADEVDDKTITYLFTRPVRRASVLMGKYFAYLVCVVLLVLPSVVLVYFLVVPIGGHIGESFPHSLQIWECLPSASRRMARSSRLWVPEETAAHRRACVRVRLGVDSFAHPRLSEASECGLLPAGFGAACHAPGLDD